MSYKQIHHLVSLVVLLTLLIPAPVVVTSYRQPVRNLLFSTALWLFALLGIIAMMRLFFWFSWLAAVESATFTLGFVVLLLGWRALQKLHHSNEELQGLLHTANEDALQQELAERKQIEIALREAEQEYRTLFDPHTTGCIADSIAHRCKTKLKSK